MSWSRLDLTLRVCAPLLVTSLCAGQNLIWAAVLHPSSLNSISKHVTRSALNGKFTVFCIITFNIWKEESSPRVTSGIVYKLFLPALSGMTYTDRAMRSVHTARRNNVPHASLPVRTLILHEARIAAEKKENLDISRKVEEALALFVARTWGDPQNITVALQVVQKAICETAVLFSTKRQA